MHQTEAQSKRILEYLQKGNSLTPLEALNMFGCMRLGARVYDLKNQGYAIVTEMVKDEKSGKTYASYRLMVEAA
ncbi:hypothetical protein EGK75_09270 [Neisseria weixii]|uniref:Winged helix-turn-helix domain-containing protein n=1 Tax=Neisseria weixii TaxID=1853276 RepID=A0A3N4NBB5_9NEIS|nr:helix-turn-helix domain-containing protein [Neisseria weixii]RPD86300.1 hypothetical protein EGK75_09270 [Neisseria weixii]RPD89380.1 hypothetical protein EGK74_03950 [Neisseria weixii]